MQKQKNKKIIFDASEPILIYKSSYNEIKIVLPNLKDIEVRIKEMP